MSIVTSRFAAQHVAMMSAGAAPPALRMALIRAPGIIVRSTAQGHRSWPMDLSHFRRIKSPDELTALFGELKERRIRRAAAELSAWELVDREDESFVIKESWTDLSSALMRGDSLVDQPRFETGLLHTAAPQLISMVVAWLTGGFNAGAESRGLQNQVQSELRANAMRMLLNVPSPVKGSDWVQILARTVDTEMFRRREQSHSGEVQKAIGDLKRVMRHLVVEGTYRESGYDDDFSLADLPEILDRYIRLLNLPTQRKVFDLTEVIECPADEKLAQVARRLDLVGKTRFDALRFLDEQYPQIRYIFAPCLTGAVLPGSVADTLRSAGLELQGIRQRSAPTVLIGDGGTGKTTIILAIGIVLDIDVFILNDTDPDSLKGPDSGRDRRMPTVLREIEKPFEKAFGGLVAAAFASRYLDYILYFDNFDPSALVQTKSARGGPFDSSRLMQLQELFDVDVTSIAISAPIPRLDLSGAIICASSNKGFPTFPPGSYAEAHLNALMTRLRIVDFAPDDKALRLHADLDELGLGEHHPLRSAIPQVCGADPDQGSRAATRAIKAVVQDAILRKAFGLPQTQAERDAVIALNVRSSPLGPSAAAMARPFAQPGVGEGQEAEAPADSRRSMLPPHLRK